MIKLIKHEFIKMRVLLILIALAFVILEGTFIYSIITKNAFLTANADNFIFGCIIISFIAIAFTTAFLLKRDLSKKTGYLTFMTPNKVSSIVISKLVCALLSVIGVMLISGILLKINHPMIENSYEIYGDYRFFTYDLYIVLSFDEASIMDLLGFAASFLFFYLALVTTLIFVITLSSIIAKNSKLNIISTLVVLIITIISIFILDFMFNSFLEATSSTYTLYIMWNDPFGRYGMLPGVFRGELYDIHKYFLYNLPLGIFQLLISVGFTWASSKIIDSTIDI